MRVPALILCCVAGLSLLGCNADSADDTAPQRIKVEFKGTVDPKFVGEWKSDDGSGLSLKKDGSLEIVAISAGPSGKISKKIDGEWLLSGSDLLLKYLQGATQVVIKNAATLSGKTLTLVQAGNKHKTIYKRTS